MSNETVTVTPEETPVKTFLVDRKRLMKIAAATATAVVLATLVVRYRKNQEDDEDSDEFTIVHNA